MRPWQVPTPPHRIDQNVMAYYEFLGTNWDGPRASRVGGLTDYCFVKTDNSKQKHNKACVTNCWTCITVLCGTEPLAKRVPGLPYRKPWDAPDVTRLCLRQVQMVTEKKRNSTQEPTLTAVLMELLWSSTDCKRAVTSFEQVHLSLLTILSLCPYLDN
jgi:hypothetical protein